MDFIKSISKKNNICSTQVGTYSFISIEERGGGRGMDRSTQEGWMIRARAERRAETASSSKLILDHGWPRLRDEKTRDIGRRIGRDGSRDRR